MGAGIEQLALQAGYTVSVKEIDEDSLCKGLDRVKGGMGRLVQKGTVTPDSRDGVQPLCSRSIGRSAMRLPRSLGGW